MKIDTLLTHGGRDPQRYAGAVNVPVHRMSTVLFADHAAWLAAEQGKRPLEQGYAYGRYGNPSTIALADTLTQLEGGVDTVLTHCGMSAISLALLTFLRAGDHALVCDNAYVPTRRWFNVYGQRNNIDVTYFNPAIDAAGLRALIRDNTRVLLLESPGSFTFELSDVPALTAFARERGIVSIGDNTWATPLYYRPFELGLDVSVHALTKYVMGHSDGLMGALISGSDAVATRVRETSSVLGISNASADDAALALRGLRTLRVRLERHAATGLMLAAELEKHPAVKQVLHPGLASHPQHALWQRDFSGCCGLFGVVLHAVDDAALARMIDGLKLFGVGYSWGGFESLLLPAPPAGLGRTCTGVPEGTLIRIHAGLEDPEDLRAELFAALERLKG